MASPVSGSKKWSERVSTATSITSPTRAWLRGPKRPTSVVSIDSAYASSQLSSPTSRASARTSSVTAARASTVK